MALCTNEMTGGSVRTKALSNLLSRFKFPYPVFLSILIGVPVMEALENDYSLTLRYCALFFLTGKTIGLLYFAQHLYFAENKRNNSSLYFAQQFLEKTVFAQQKFLYFAQQYFRKTAFCVTFYAVFCVTKLIYFCILRKL